MSTIEVKQFVVEDLKIRLDKFLSEQILSMSRSRIQRDIESGKITVNDRVVQISKSIVRSGDRITYSITPDQQPGPVNIPIHTLYNNHGLLILDKPAGLAVHPGAGFTGDSLAQALLYHFKDIYLVGEEGRSGIVHRLDKDTSGVMLVALTQVMYEHLKDAFTERKVKKEYIALVCGNITQSHGFIESPLGKSKKDFRKYTTIGSDMVLSKPSLTEYHVLEHLATGIDEYTLIVVKLHTGRTHQIRVHFSSLGFPLVGDQLYGGKKAMKLGLARQFLHSKKIAVQLLDQSWIEAESEFPKDLTEILTLLHSSKVNNL